MARHLYQGKPCPTCQAPLDVIETFGATAVDDDGTPLNSATYCCRSAEQHLWGTWTDFQAGGPGQVRMSLRAMQPQPLSYEDFWRLFNDELGTVRDGVEAAAAPGGNGWVLIGNEFANQSTFDRAKAQAEPLWRKFSALYRIKSR